MGRTVDFVVILDDGVRKRHYHQATHGRISRFMVQLEVYLGREWKTIVRYDSAHGFAHKDLFDRKGNQKKVPIELTFESALSFGDWDINTNWQAYVEAFASGEEPND